MSLTYQPITVYLGSTEAKDAAYVMQRVLQIPFRVSKVKAKAMITDVATAGNPVQRLMDIVISIPNASNTITTSGSVPSMTGTVVAQVMTNTGAGMDYETWFSTPQVLQGDAYRFAAVLSGDTSIATAVGAQGGAFAVAITFYPYEQPEGHISSKRTKVGADYQ
jgi:hypothetical protein